MSVNTVNKTTGQLSRVAGKTANGELIPSVSMYQSGTVVITAKETAYGTYGITFPEPMPDDDYIVNLSISGLSGGNWHNKTFNVSYENKTQNGFVICVGKPNDTAIEAGVTVTWQAFKLMTDENRVLDEQQIAEHETEITAIQDVIPSSASADNQLATKNDIGAIDTSYQATKSLDFNDFKGENNKIIHYWLRYGDTWDNCPTSSFGSIDWILLTVENVAGRVQQTVLIQKTNNKSERWTRAFVYADPTSQTVWGGWVRITTSNDIAAIQAVIPYKIDRVRYNLANTNFPSSLVGSDIVTWLNARATDSVFRKPGIHIVELYNTATDNYGYFFIQNLGTQGADTVAAYGVAEFKTYYTAGGRPYYFLLKQSTWSLMHDANNMYLERSNLTPTATTVILSPTDNTADNVTLRLRKTGNVVTATYFNSGTDSGTLKSSWTVIGTIPTGYRPTDSMYTTVNHANSHNVTVGLQFHSDGTVRQYAYTEGNLGYERSVNLTWITG